ncbi:MAG: hypothetical protein U0514_01100 [Candidatus Andersenbacteria bacterium]
MLVAGLVLGAQALFFTSEINWRYARVVVALTALAYFGTYVLGRLTFPFAHPEVAVHLSQPSMGLAAALFSIKERLAALGVIVAIGLLLLCCFGQMPTTTIQRQRLLGSLFATLGLLTGFLIAIGVATLR